MSSLIFYFIWIRFDWYFMNKSDHTLLSSIQSSFDNKQPYLTYRKLLYGPCQANLVLIAYASSEGSGEPAHPRSLARTSATRSYKQRVKRNLQTDPWPLWMAGHTQLKFVMTECLKTQIRLTWLRYLSHDFIITNLLGEITIHNALHFLVLTYVCMKMVCNSLKFQSHPIAIREYQWKSSLNE